MDLLVSSLSFSNSVTRSVTLINLPNMWRKSRSSPSERYIAPPDDGIEEEEEEEEEAVPDLLAKARRRGASVALSMDVQKRDAPESKPARRLSRRRASVRHHAATCWLRTCGRDASFPA